MNIWKTSAIAATLLTSATAFGQVSQLAYDNTRVTQEKFYQVSSPQLEVGDELTLSLASGIINRIQFEYYLTGSGNETAQVTLRTVNGDQPGDIFFQTAPFALSIPTTTSRQAQVDLNNLVIPYTDDQLILSVNFGGIEASDVAGLPFYAGPDIGSSQADFWLFGSSQGPALASTPEASGNFSIRITAVPEPSTWAMLMGGLGFLGFLGYRSRKS